MAHPSSCGVGPDQQTLYTAIFAAGATPEISPRSRPATLAGTPWLPAAVLAVCEPWPLPSRGETYSARSAPMESSAKLSRKYRAPMSFVEQSSAANCSPVTQAPRKRAPSAFSKTIDSPSRYGSAPGASPSGSPANDGFSGATPVSMTPTTTPSPAESTPPVAFQTPPSPLRPRKSVDGTAACTCRSSSFTTARTRESAANAAAWSAVSVLLKPLVASV